MSGEKIFVVLVGLVILTTAIPTIQALPMPPPYVHRGDIVFADEMPKKPAINGWDHAALYNGSGYIIEADPHTEEWPGGFVPPNLLPRWRLKQLEDNYGKIEWTEKQHVAIAYCKVIGLSQDKLNTLRYRVTRFAYDKLTDPDDDGIEEHPEHRFDLISYWKDDTKQESGSSERAQRYYCSELVWAAYRYASRNYIGITVDMDPDSHKVTPLEIHDSDWTECYWQYGTPW